MNLYSAHRQWASRPSDERYPDLDSLHEAVKARRASSDETGLLNHTELNASTLNDKLGLQEGQELMEFTNWSSRQFMTKLGAPPDFVAKLTPSVAQDVLNDRLKGCEPFSASLLVGKDEDGTVVRAFNGERYTRLWDSDITSVLKNRMPFGWRNPVAYANGEWGGNLVPSGLYASDRDMFAFFVSGGDFLEEEGAGPINRGFFVWNSEVGSRTFGWSSFLFRVVCGNHIIWDANNVTTTRARHTKHIGNIFDSFELFLLRLQESEAKDATAKMLAEAKNRMLINPMATDDEIISYFRGKGNFTPTESIGARDRMLIEEKSPTGSVWDWVNGFTAYARTFPHVATRNALETRASLLLPR